MTEDLTCDSLDVKPGDAGYEAPHPAERQTGLAGLVLDPANQATELVEIARKQFDMFCSPDGRAWAVERAGPNIAIPISRRGKFAMRLARTYIETYGKAPGDVPLAGAERILTAFLDDGQPRPVFLRVGRHESSIILDLGTADGSCVVVTADGWKVERRSPAPFRRGKMTALPEPVRGNGLVKLQKILNLTDDGFRLTIACLVSYLIPGIPYPILLVRGEQGTAKTTFTKIVILCIDPGRDPGRLPRDERTFGIRMWNGHLHGFDNLSDIADYQSDMICRAATGDDPGERVLYSDDELLGIAYRRPIIINGIDFGALKPDLADRAVPLTLAKIADGQRRPERRAVGGKRAGILDRFDEAHPEILGALLDLLSGVLKYLPEVNAVLPRMADFGNVLAALDIRHREINGAPHPRPLLPMYKRLWQDAVAESGRDDSLCNSVIELMKKHPDGWDGMTAELLEVLTGRLPNPDKPPKDWPTSSQAFGHRIAKINPGLRANGWEIIRGKHTRQGTPCSISRFRASLSPSSPSSQAAPDLGEYRDELGDEPRDQPSWDDISPPGEDDGPDDGKSTAGLDRHGFITGFVTDIPPGQNGWCDKGDDVTNLPESSMSDPLGATADSDGRTVACTVCGEPLDRALIAAGFTTHGEDPPETSARTAGRNQPHRTSRAQRHGKGHR